MSVDARQVVYNYHERSKHRRDGYARGPEYLDWQDQPNPFRHYDGCTVVSLPLTGEIKQAEQTIYTLENLGALLQLSMGLSAWKQFGPDRWSLRCNPSSGNLHPTETYILASGIEGLSNGVYHYRVYEHALEQRAHLVAQKQPVLIIGLSSILWREAWKYGERSYRYIQLDVGHAIGAIAYAARTLGLRLRLLSHTDDEISKLLGIDRTDDFTDVDSEHPDILLQLYNDEDDLIHTLPQTENWTGTANILGGYPRHDWKVLKEITEATVCTSTEKDYLAIPAPCTAAVTPDKDLMQIIRQRRSAQAYLGKRGVITTDSFYQILQAMLNTESLPLCSWPDRANIHPVIMLHHVDGLQPGLYIQPRSEESVDELRNAMSSEFVWQPINPHEASIPLYLLQAGDFRKSARAISCHQEIAASSAFTLGMLAEFDTTVAGGAHHYRQLYHEAGLLGQVLYIEAEKAGLSGTGIGCFFDDVFHEMLGLEGTMYQSLYHFCIGRPKHDARLQTLPPYGHLT